MIPNITIAAFQEDPSTATWAGTEIETNDGVVTYKDFIESLLDDSAPPDLGSSSTNVHRLPL